MIDYPGLDLLPQHAAFLRTSAIAPTVARARGYRSARRPVDLGRLGFAERQRNVPALLIPVWGVDGAIGLYQARPDTPRVSGAGKPIKYETPGKARMCLDVPPTVRHRLDDPRVPLWFTEGVRKADAAASADLCCVALLGVWNWRGTNDVGGTVALPDFERIAFNARDTFVCFDSDVMAKSTVHAALARFRGFLKGRGARVWLVYLPAGPGGAKVGLDDYLAAGHTVDDLLARATDELRAAPREDAPAHPYVMTPAGLTWHKPTPHGPVPTPLTNFAATIVADVAEDDGSGEVRRALELAAALHGREQTFTLPAERFAAMNWPVEHLGAGAIVYPGQGAREHTRAAIQLLSGEIAERRVYTHTGWREHGGGWVYLHAGGAIAAGGTVAGVAVALPGALAGL
ncbi:MAG TPA: DUF3854 domain-containing protein, partial [Thermomicrobiales bacterium]|nr:DUF3854 domain-containing protein [Thermomicrobiales bacterium]